MKIILNLEKRGPQLFPNIHNILSIYLLKHPSNFLDFLSFFYNAHPELLPYQFANHDGATVFHIAASLNKKSLFTFLLTLDPSGLEIPDRRGMTPIFYAIRSDHLQMVQYLISLNANVHHQDRKLSTPCYLSVLYASFTIFKLLVDSGSEINVQNRYKRTPLMKAVYLCFEDKTRYLLKQPGIQVNLTDSNGRNALHMACWGNGGGRKGKVIRNQIYGDFFAVVPDLLAAGADIEERDRDGNTPLMVSCSTNALDCVKFWHQKGYSFDHTNIYGENPLMIASRYGNYSKLIYRDFGDCLLPILGFISEVC